MRPVFREARLVLTSSVLALGVACSDPLSPGAVGGEETSLASSASGASTVPGTVPFLGDPRLIAHSGTRRVDTIDWTSGSALMASFLERITTDGRGGYSVEAEDAITPVQPNEETFLLLQSIHQGLIFRYRGFAIRDAALFSENWLWRELGSTTTVAGRTCREVAVERRAPGTDAIELAIDSKTGLVLRTLEYDDQSRLVAAVTYTSFDPPPDPSSFVPYAPINQERELDLERDLGDQVGVSELLAPRVLPVGYQLREASTVMDDLGVTYLKMTYFDGVRSLFFVQELPDAQTADGSYSKSVDADRAASFECGALAVLQAEVGGHSVIVLGNLDVEELADVLESALP